jgi:hypothetical protein
MNGSRYYALCHAAIYITLRSDLLHIVEKPKIAYATSWHSKRISWIRYVEEPWI